MPNFIKGFGGVKKYLSYKLGDWNPNFYKFVGIIHLVHTQSFPKD